MASTMTLIAHIGSDGADLVHLMEGVDAQTLPYDAFDVTFLLEDAPADIAQRLDELASRRPNVQVRHLAEGGLAAAVDEAAGQWLLYLSPAALAAGVAFRPQALERLGAFAAAHDCDIVVGRADDAAGNINDLFVTDQANAADLPPAALMHPFTVVCRKEFAARHGLVRSAGDAERALDVTKQIAVLGSYPCVVVGVDPSRAVREPVAITGSVVDWSEGRVIVRVRGRAPDAADGEVRFAVRRGGDQYWVPGEAAVSADGTFTASAQIDVRTAALGERLPDGIWQVNVGIHGHGSGWAACAAVPAAQARPGVVDGILVAPTRAGAALALDVGATRSTVIPRLAVPDVTIEESAAGVLMTVRLPGLHTTGTSRTDGYLLLGKFPLRAVLAVEADRATLTCLLSGLAGTSRLATRFGSAAPAPTGLNLVISPVGHMSVVPTPKAKPATSRKNAATNPSAATRARRRVPTAFEPVVRAVARNEAARTLYRRLGGGSGKRA